MRYTRLGRTGLDVSVIGFGGIPIQRLGLAEAKQVLTSAVNMGINYFDTARAYTDSEEKIGSALQDRRSQVYLATKTLARTKAEAARDIAESLRRLRTNYIDVYQLHNVDNETIYAQVMGPGGALEALEEAKSAGKVGHIGMSTHSHRMALVGLRSGEFETLMVALNFVETEVEQEVIPLAHELDIAVIGMKPLGGGALTKPKLALKYVLVRGVTLTIPGMMSVAEVEENASVGNLNPHLTLEEEAEIEQELRLVGRNFCRACDYCQPCPQGIPISEVLKSTLVVKRFGPRWLEGGRFQRLASAVESCLECGDCESRCPYHLAIPTLLQEKLKELCAAYAELQGRD
ncbi:MAG: aldo/keto reductase [Chloroflexi bacterium]|nr:aldo/keto reductase [Chloroflexota bacterium]